MKILIYYTTAGHGHRKVAEVIEQSFRERGLSSDEVKAIDALEETPYIFRKFYPTLYYYAVKYLPKIWGWFYETLDKPRFYSLVQPVRRLANGFYGLRLLKNAIAQKPDVIISTHFFPCEVFGWAKRSGKLKAQLMTVVTDFHPHRFWMNRGTDVYWVMSQEGAETLKTAGVSRDQTVVGGIPSDPQFQPLGRRSEILKQWAFSEKRLTLLLTSGSFGLSPHVKILQSLQEFKDRIQCFVVCGNNTKLRREMELMKFDFPVKVFGFVNFMAELMEASDMIIAKPGGATTAESLIKGIPMIVHDPIPGQEAYNALVLKERNAAFFIEKPEQTQLIIKNILAHPGLLHSKQKAIAGLAKPHAAEDLVSFVLRGESHEPSIS